ncbi:hypothetical protein chiPu_0031860 [Chiloscyllium punctatum]|uniref:Uncharacterized protein n=1 Tax=Chiloscyllium punctatum TaxID=137246 RepID=A0A401TZA3_CHIPU|nr:hypothetical protein [Chiloscyllium punctatum]
MRTRARPLRAKPSSADRWSLDWKWGRGGAKKRDERMRRSFPCLPSPGGGRGMVTLPRGTWGRRRDVRSCV